MSAFTEPVGVGIVGLSARGGWASLAHVPALAAVDGLELRALSASSPESAELAGRTYGVRHHPDAASLAQDPQVDLVVVAVKVSTHRALIEPALDAGKMVFCEWPLGNGAAEGNWLAERASELGLRTFVGLQARAAPAIRHLRELIADGYVGRVLSSTLTASGISWGAVTYPDKTYLLDREEGASMLTIPVGHTLDALQFVLGDFDEVQATTSIRRENVGMHKQPGVTHRKTVADQIAAQGVLADGTVVAAHFRGGSTRATDFHWEINGEEGDIVVRGDSGAFLQYGQVHVSGARGGQTQLEPLPTPARLIAVPSLPEYGSHAFTVAHGYAQVLEDLRHGTAHAPDFHHAARLHDLLAAIETSAASGTRIRL